MPEKHRSVRTHGKPGRLSVREFQEKLLLEGIKLTNYDETELICPHYWALKVNEIKPYLLL